MILILRTRKERPLICSSFKGLWVWDDRHTETAPEDDRTKGANDGRVRKYDQWMIGYRNKTKV